MIAVQALEKGRWNSRSRLQASAPKWRRSTQDRRRSRRQRERWALASGREPVFFGVFYSLHVPRRDLRLRGVLSSRESGSIWLFPAFLLFFAGRFTLPFHCKLPVFAGYHLGFLTFDPHVSAPRIRQLD